MEIPLIDLKANYHAVRGEVDLAISNVLEGQQFFPGPNVEGFEHEFAQYIGTQYAVGVSSGTDALQLALKAHGVGIGDGVIVPAFGFVATAAAVVTAGATPIFVDVDHNGLIDCVEVERLVRQRKNIKAVMAVHLYGQPINMAPLTCLQKDEGIVIIEDCAQAHGALYNMRKCGSIGDIGCFSFFPTKPLGAYGEAGAITTNNSEVAKRVRMLSNHGRIGSHMDAYGVVGYNERLDEIQAAVLRHKLRHLDDWLAKRVSLAGHYDYMLNGRPDWLTTLAHQPDGAYCYYVVQVRPLDRDPLREHLKARGIGTGIHYQEPITATVPYQHYPRVGEMAVSRRLADTILSLPMYPELTKGQVEVVCGAIKEFYV